MAQDNLWVNGSQLLDFNNPNGQVNVCTLPTGGDYNGAPAQYSENAQYDENGKLLFFVVDGNIYDYAGYLIADNDSHPTTCVDCLLKGIQEVAITAVPGTCDMYYVIAAGVNYGTSAMAYSIVDLSLENPFHPGRFGKVLSEFDLPANFQTAMLANDQLYAHDGMVSPSNGELSSFWLASGDAGINTVGPVVEPDANLQFTIFDSNVAGQPKTLFAKTEPEYLQAQITDQGITSFTYMGNNLYHHGQLYGTGGMEVAKGPDHIIRLAASNNNLLSVESQFNTIEVFNVQFAGGTSTLGTQVSLNTNINGYTLTNSYAVRGIAFSPNGRYLYFDQNFAPYVGYVDMMDPTHAIHDLGAELGANLSAYGKGQIAANTDPVGSANAIYFPFAGGMGYLDHADDPANLDPTWWHPTVPSTGTLNAPPQSAAASTMDHPVTQYLMDKQNWNDQQLANLGQVSCCLYNDRIPEDSHNEYDEATHTYYFAGTNTYANPWTPLHNGLTDESLCPLADGTTIPSDHAYFSHDFHVKPGARLYVRDMDWRFADTARLVIEPGAFVQFDSCLIEGGRCEPTRWPGVSLLGHAYQAQGFSIYPPHQGRMVFNTSTLKDAIVGVTVGIKSSGGILNTSGSLFLNCEEGVKFYPYQNINATTGALLANRSSLSTTKFTVDDNYPAAIDFKEHLYMWKVDGIVLKADTFENARSIYSDGYSQQLGQGITSLDANYQVLAGCSQIQGIGQPCPFAYQQPCLFRGLDHGIDASDATTSRNFTVDRAQFVSNVCGVFADGVVSYEVTKSHFKLGERELDMSDNIPEVNWEGRYRGIYSYDSWGFAVDDDTLQQEGDHTETEGIVIGYSRDHNDVVFRNVAQGLESGYIGEGICADDEAGYTAINGLQFICNHNNNNSTDIWSRKVTTDNVYPQNLHTIRLNQGDPDRPADNTFDQWPVNSGNWDFKVTTTNSPIGYWHNGTAPYVPVSYTQSPYGLFPELATTIPANNCASKIPGVMPPGPYQPGPVIANMTNEKLAYGNTRYLYDQLIDDGNTDEVVTDIEESWPQDAWALHDYLMAKSPNLSTTVLKQMVLQAIMPDAMVTEILVANPAGTRSSGFINWLQDNSGHPLPDYMLSLVMASWDQKSYRDVLVGEMAHHHAEMTQSADMLIQHYRADTVGTPLDSVLWVWQQMRTVSARYAEALTWLEEGNYAQATNAIDTIPTGINTPDELERQRMLDLISFLQGVHVDGRTEADLDSGEVATLQTLRSDNYDRPATWISNLLCFNYGICRSPLTGGDGQGDTRALHYTLPPTTASVARPELKLHPNPAQSWVAFDYDLQAAPDQARLTVNDATGREVFSTRLTAQQQQVLWDSRKAAPGTYTVMLLNGGHQLCAAKLIVQP